MYKLGRNRLLVFRPGPDTRKAVCILFRRSAYFRQSCRSLPLQQYLASTCHEVSCGQQQVEAYKHGRIGHHGFINNLPQQEPRLEEPPWWLCSCFAATLTRTRYSLMQLCWWPAQGPTVRLGPWLRGWVFTDHSTLRHPLLTKP